MSWEVLIFASVGLRIAIGLSNPGYDGARMIFGSIFATGIIAILIALLASKIMRFFPRVVAGTISLVTAVTPIRKRDRWVSGCRVTHLRPKRLAPNM